ncbi:hypothetical protein [Dokdonella sp.]|uniref:hypothetical protein n=1 Tax=Dokdonella sp. TaxID=2291710 RepID=UPI003C6967FC
MQFTTIHPITQIMAAAITDAVREYDAGAIVRAEVSSQRVMIEGDLSVAQARAALFMAHCDPVELQDGADLVHIQGGHTCCGHCT